jgi:hypothetical protein
MTIQLDCRWLVDLDFDNHGEPLIGGGKLALRGVRPGVDDLMP